ncbi:PREDICTED: uncharacterized protein LOC104763045 [Camelina sativa]|uniref:Uncharacterized protein LOC104763045 n=1 Tax=Camelina sativa TaxID=90675 RepID=A0ABM1R901_CAMSA|nr:PREDICTED: uncharacterized protein LOC104763045 [Camelina sativa]
MGIIKNKNKISACVFVSASLCFISDSLPQRSHLRRKKQRQTSDPDSAQVYIDKQICESERGSRENRGSNTKARRIRGGNFCLQVNNSVTMEFSDQSLQDSSQVQARGQSCKKGSHFEEGSS